LARLLNAKAAKMPPEPSAQAPAAEEKKEETAVPAPVTEEKKEEPTEQAPEASPPEATKEEGPAAEPAA
jgi:hypothetical protein